jgi:hypothetical protein
MSRSARATSAHHPAAAGLVILVILLATAGPPAAGEVVTIDGVPHVRNGATPAEGVRTWRLEELWRAGGEDDDIFFGLVTKVAADPEGRVYVLDAQLCQVHVYAPDGTHLRTLFGEGEGPGEVRDPRDMFLLAGGRVAACEEFPGRLVIVHADGTPDRAVTLTSEDGAFHSLTAGERTGDAFLLSGTHNDRAENGVSPRIYYLSRYSPAGEELVRCAESRAVYDFRDFLFDEEQHVPGQWWNFSAGPDGRIYVAPDRGRYAVRVLEPDGTPVRVIERECGVWRRTDAEKRQYHDCIDGAMAGSGVPYRIAVEENEPVIALLQRGVRARADGTLWVLPAVGIHDQDAGIMATWDVFDEEGRFARQVRLAGPDRGDQDGMFFAGPDRLLVVKGYLDAMAAQFGRARILDEDEEPEPMQVVCYRIARD